MLYHTSNQGAIYPEEPMYLAKHSRVCAIVPCCGSGSRGSIKGWAIKTAAVQSMLQPAGVDPGDEVLGLEEGVETDGNE
jgi:hypothetical protein